MFLCNGSSKLDNHSIHPDWRLSSNHAPLTIVITIIEEHINSGKHSIIRDSKEELTFIKDLTTSNMSDIASLDRAVNKFADAV